MNFVQRSTVAGLAASALLSVAASASAQVVSYDSLTSVQLSTGNRYAQCLDGTCGAGASVLLTDATYTYANLSSGETTAVGDLVQLAPSTGVLNAFQYALLVDTGFVGSLNVSATLEIYSALTSPAVSIDLGSFTYPFVVPVSGSQGQIVEVTTVLTSEVDLSNLLVTSSDQLYYTLKVSTNSTPATGFGVLLLDEFSSSILTGSDVDTNTWLQSTTLTPVDGTTGVVQAESVASNSFTPAVRFIMSPVPEVSTYAMLAAGLGAVLVLGQRRRQA